MMDDPLTPGGDADQGPPPSLICPITQELLEDPVIAADGLHVEGEAIERWLGMGTNRRSPTTNAPLAHRALVPNRSLARTVSRRWAGPSLSCRGRGGSKMTSRNV